MYSAAAPVLMPSVSAWMRVASACCFIAVMPSAYSRAGCRMAVNGGSCVAMLAFIGTLATKYRPISEFAFPLIMFATGAGFAVLASAAGYFTNLLIVGSSQEMNRQYVEPFLRDSDKSKRQRFWGEVLRWHAVGFAAVGILSFFVGLYTAYSAFRHL